MKTLWIAVLLLMVLPLRAEEPNEAARHIAKLESLNPPELALLVG